MKNILGFIFLISLISCQNNRNGTNTVSCFEKPNTLQEHQSETEDSLFKLDINNNENFVRIIAPKKSDFEFPDSSAKTEPQKYGDFNADGKEDVMVYLGACGTGGCMYGLFLNQYENYYKLAFMDYLKNAEFKIEKNGMWTIESTEELEAYNPYKLHISIFKFNKDKYIYEIDTTFVYHDKKGEKMMNE